MDLAGCVHDLSIVLATVNKTIYRRNILGLSQSSTVLIFLGNVLMQRFPDWVSYQLE